MKMANNMVLMALMFTTGVIRAEETILQKSTNTPSTGNTNQVVDFILDHLSTAMAQEGRSEVKVQDLKRTFTTKVLLLTVNGNFTATRGKITGFGSFTRKGDAVLKKDGDSVILSADFGMKEFVLVYENYNVSSEGVYQRGEIKVKAANNSLNFQVQVIRKKVLYVKTKCSSSLVELNTRKVGNFEMEITNLGIFKNVKNDIYLMLVDEINSYYQNHINTVVRPKMSEAIQAADLCSNLK